MRPVRKGGGATSRIGAILVNPGDLHAVHSNGPASRLRALRGALGDPPNLGSPERHHRSRRRHIVAQDHPVFGKRKAWYRQRPTRRLGIRHDGGVPAPSDIPSRRRVCGTFAQGSGPPALPGRQDGRGDRPPTAAQDSVGMSGHRPPARPRAAGDRPGAGNGPAGEGGDRGRDRGHAGAEEIVDAAPVHVRAGAGRPGRAGAAEGN